MHEYHLWNCVQYLNFPILQIKLPSYDIAASKQLRFQPPGLMSKVKESGTNLKININTIDCK